MIELSFTGRRVFVNNVMYFLFILIFFRNLCHKVFISITCCVHFVGSGVLCTLREFWCTEKLRI